MKLSTIAALFFVVSTVDATSRHGGSTSSNSHGVNRHESPARGNGYYRRLHDILHIKEDDPNQDIRTNIILNMEGL
jgi:hypothetical protein